MRRLLPILFVLLFFPLIVGFDWTVDDPGPLWNTPTVKFAFDDSYTGMGRTLIIIECELLDSADTQINLITIRDDDGLTPVDGLFVIPVRTHVEGLPDGIYHARVRASDSMGNFSDWSQFLYFRKAWQPLPTPGGCVLMR